MEQKKTWRRMWLLAGYLAGWLGGYGVQSEAAAETPSTTSTGTLGLRTPALSPDGKTLAFGYQGDIWRVAVEGGRPVRLTAHPAYDERPRWSVDGRTLLFTSRRSGNRDVYIMPSEGGKPRRLTFHSADDVGLDWAPDGTWILFSSDRENRRSLYRVWLKGGMPERLVPGFWNFVHSASIGPKGLHLLLAERSETLGYWWRKGYQGPNYGRIHTFGLRTHYSVQLNRGPESAQWPMWSGDGKTAYYAAGKGKVVNLWSIPITPQPTAAPPTKITHFQSDSVRWPSINRAGTHIVYERGFGIWITDLKTGLSKRLAIEIDADIPHPTKSWKQTSKISEFSLSPDGKKLAFIAEGDVFVTDAMGKTAIRRLTETPWRELQLTWAQDSIHVYYVSERGKGYGLYRHSARADGKEESVIQSTAMLLYPRVSPDGKHIVYLEGKNHWMLLSQGQTKPRLLVEAQIGSLLNDPPRWSPDSQWVMYMAYDRGRGDLWAKRIDQSAPVLLTPTASNDHQGAWTPDGKYLIYTSNQYGSDWFHDVGGNDLYVLPLRRKTLKFKEDKLDKLFQDPKKPSGKDKAKKSDKSGKSDKSKKASKAKKDKNAKPSSQPTKKKSAKSRATAAAKDGKKGGKKAKKKVTVRIDTKDLRERISRVTHMKGSEAWPHPSPNGKQVLFFSNSLGATTLWIAPFKDGRLVAPKPVAPGLRFGSLWGSYGLTWAPKGKAVYLLHKGRIVRIAMPKGAVQRLPLRVRVQIDQKARFLQMFREVWVTLRDHFYDPKMNGQDWQAVYQRFLPAVSQVQTQEDWRDLLNEMLGTLNASHLGVYGPFSQSPYQTGTLGADIKIVQGKFRIVRILRHGPLYHALPKGPFKGLQLKAINGIPLDAHTNLHQRLEATLQKRVRLTLSWPHKGAKGVEWKQKDIKLKPISYRSEQWLRYRAWVDSRREWVAKYSNGRIGYLHMRDMGRSSLYRFYQEYETDVTPKAAAIIDVRFNNGGNVHDSVLQYLSRRRYATWQVRGLRRWNEPAFAVLPKPLAMMINERSLSDAEMTANGFKALKLGTLVGAPTYRWLIFTYHAPLLNGGFFRLPDWGCFTLQGQDLEKIGVSPDVTVYNTFAHRLRGEDPQLKATVDILLKKLSSKASK